MNTGAAGRQAAWSALRAARRASAPRVPFFVRGVAAGSVAQAHLDVLRHFDRAVRIDDGGVHALDDDPSEALAPVNLALRTAGLVKAWRDELFALPHPGTLQPLARIERAASRFWGTLTLGAHATGFVRGADGRPSHLWIAQRSLSKATDPGLFDNLIGGGVGFGQTPRDTLVREAFEEAGLAPSEVAGAVPGRVIGLARDVPEGFQQEWLYGFDIELPPGRTPVNQDGEVATFRCLTVVEAASLAAGEAMTVDAALVTLDFLLRHGCLEGAGPGREVAGVEVTRLGEALNGMLVTAPI